MLDIARKLYTRMPLARFICHLSFAFYLFHFLLDPFPFVLCGKGEPKNLNENFGDQTNSSQVDFPYFELPNEYLNPDNLMYPFLPRSEPETIDFFSERPQMDFQLPNDFDDDYDELSEIGINDILHTNDDIPFNEFIGYDGSSPNSPTPNYSNEGNISNFHHTTTVQPISDPSTENRTNSEENDNFLYFPAFEGNSGRNSNENVRPDLSPIHRLSSRTELEESFGEQSRVANGSPRFRDASTSTDDLQQFQHPLHSSNTRFGFGPDEGGHFIEQGQAQIFAPPTTSFTSENPSFDLPRTFENEEPPNYPSTQTTTDSHVRKRMPRINWKTLPSSCRVLLRLDVGKGKGITLMNSIAGVSVLFYCKGPKPFSGKEFDFYRYYYSGEDEKYRAKAYFKKGDLTPRNVQVNDEVLRRLKGEKEEVVFGREIQFGERNVVRMRVPNSDGTWSEVMETDEFVMKNDYFKDFDWRGPPGGGSSGCV